MKIIFSNAIINIDNIAAIYSKGGYLCFETTTAVFYCSDNSNKGLQQIAVALAEGKTFIEMDDVLTGLEEEPNDTGSDIE